MAGKDTKIISNSHIKDLTSLLEYYNLSLEDWKVDKCIPNMWEVTGFDKKTGEQKTVQNHQIKAWLSKKIKNVDNKTDFVKELVEEIKHYSTQVPPRIRKVAVNRNMLLVNLSDLHLGRLSWAVETGFGNYDIKIAVKIVNDAVDTILQRAKCYDIGKIVFLVGGDYFNYNTSNPYPQTVNGTPQESDVRQTKMFRIGRQLACRQIERFAEVADVKVLMVAGNHDSELLFGLGEVLEAKYENNKRITVDNSPNVRKYLSFGSTLIGASHGKYEKKANLPMLMANESKRFSISKYKYFHVGHRHHERVEDYQGVLIITAPTPAEVDSHESKMGYTMSNRCIKAWIYGKSEGEIASITHNIKSKY